MGKQKEIRTDKELDKMKLKCFVCDEKINHTNYGVGFQSQLFKQEVFICQRCFKDKEDSFLDMVGRENLDRCVRCNDYLFSKAYEINGQQYCLRCEKFATN